MVVRHRDVISQPIYSLEPVAWKDTTGSWVNCCERPSTVEMERCSRLVGGAGRGGVVRRKVGLRWGAPLAVAKESGRSTGKASRLMGDGQSDVVIGKMGFTRGVRSYVKGWRVEPLVRVRLSRRRKSHGIKKGSEENRGRIKGIDPTNFQNQNEILFLLSLKT